MKQLIIYIDQNYIFLIYKKPKVTITDTLQDPKQIEEKLKNYIELKSSEVEDIVIGSHLRYITLDKKTNSERFCTGGLLRVKNSKYVILAGKDNLTFSVQRYFRDGNDKIIYKTRFFKKLKPTEILKDDLIDTAWKRHDWTNLDDTPPTQQDKMRKWMDEIYSRNVKKKTHWANARLPNGKKVFDDSWYYSKGKRKQMDWDDFFSKKSKRRKDET